MFKPGQLDLGTGEETLVTRQIMAVKASQTEESKWSKEILEAGLQDNTWLGIWNSLKIGKDYAGLEHYGLEDDMVTYERHLYIPDNNSWKLKVTYQCHDTVMGVLSIRIYQRQLSRRHGSIIQADKTSVNACWITAKIY